MVLPDAVLLEDLGIVMNKTLLWNVPFPMYLIAFVVYTIQWKKYFYVYTKVIMYQFASQGIASNFFSSSGAIFHG